MSSLLTGQALVDDIVKRGYLTKQGRIVKSWKKRFFVLKNGALAYYKSPDDVTPLGSMSLFRASCLFVGNASSNERMHTIMVKTPDRTLLIQSTDLAEMKEWAVVIQKVAILETSNKGADIGYIHKDEDDGEIFDPDEYESSEEEEDE